MKTLVLLLAAIAALALAACALNPHPGEDLVPPSTAPSTRGILWANPYLAILLTLSYTVETARISAADSAAVLIPVRAGVTALEDVEAGGYQLASDTLDSANKVLAKTSAETRTVLEPYFAKARDLLEALKDQG